MEFETEERPDTAAIDWKTKRLLQEARDDQEDAEHGLGTWMESTEDNFNIQKYDSWFPTNTLRIWLLK